MVPKGAHNLYIPPSKILTNSQEMVTELYITAHLQTWFLDGVWLPATIQVVLGFLRETKKVHWLKERLILTEYTLEI